MTGEPMTDEQFWVDASVLAPENRSLFEAGHMVIFRRWAEHMRASGTRLHTRAGLTIDADVIDAVLSTLDAERSRADTAEAERDAAVARAMPEPKLMRTVEEVEALPEGNYLVQWPGGHKAQTQRRRHDPWDAAARWHLPPRRPTDLIGAWISGPLPDLYIPPTEAPSCSE